MNIHFTRSKRYSSRQLFLFNLWPAFLLCLLVSNSLNAGEAVNITDKIPYVDVIHNGEKVRILRNPDNENTIDFQYSMTSRPCPPYCIQPIKLAEGIETIGELELLDYLKRKSKGDTSILVIDSREAEWLASGMIPGAINLPWTQIHNKTMTEKRILELFEFKFDVVQRGKLFEFQYAKTLVFYCNGPWCGQSPSNIRSLTALGYPASKLKWYRGGMQSWKAFGLTTVKP